MRPVAAGFSLVEVLLALALGLTLTAASFGILQRARGLFAGNEGVTQLQDAARQALAPLVSDIEHAGFYGLAPATNVELAANGVVLASGDDLRQPTAERAVAPAEGLPPGAHDCGANFAVDLYRPVQATDNRYALGDGECEPTPGAGGARAGTDTLTLRHASLEPAAPRAGRLQIRSLAADAGPLRLFADGRDPDGGGHPAEIRDLEVRSYYIAHRAVGDPGMAALRVKTLTESRGRVQFRDEEVMPGIEDLQVELGVRTEVEGTTSVRYVTPDDAAAVSGTVVAVRLWLRVRAASADPRSRDQRAYAYSNTRFAPQGEEDRFRRLLVTRTVALRNTS